MWNKEVFIFERPFYVDLFRDFATLVCLRETIRVKQTTDEAPTWDVAVLLLMGRTRNRN
jgi:hypothetical protein